MLCYQHLLFGFSFALSWAVSLAQFQSNIFLNGEYQNGIKAHPSKLQTINPTANIFLEHAIISRQAAPFKGPIYLPPEEILKCSAGKQCVAKDQCLNGYFANPSLKTQNCKTATHTCCIYKPPPQPSTTERPFDVCSKDHDCVPAQFCNNGEIDLEDYVQKLKSDRCYAPEVCCRIPSTTLTDDGYVLRTPDVKFAIPTTDRSYQPAASSQNFAPPRQPPSVPRDYLPPTKTSTAAQPIIPNNQNLSPAATAPTRPAFTPASQPIIPNNQNLIPAATAPSRPAFTPASQPITPNSQNLSPAATAPSRPAFTPASQPIIPNNQYLSPAATAPSRPAFTPAPYSPNTFSATSQPLTPPGQEYRTPITAAPSRPVFTQTSYTPDTAANNIIQRQQQPGPKQHSVYLPPNSPYQPSDYHVKQPSNTVIQSVSPSAPTPRPSPPQYGEDILSLPLHRQHLSKCASALECTPENFCNSLGVITDQPVDISPAESAFRVPLTDCILENGAAGKCCRDSNYVDPWPINLAGVCAARNTNTKPQGIQDVDANFGEIPWQAMILKESTKTLLGGGAIIGDQIVLTSASVVKGLAPNDLKVKGGEWELGRDSEPLPSQIVGVKSIDIHPEYNPSTGSNDMAVLRLDKRIEFAQHIKPICVTNEDPKAGERCIATGWGKQAIRSHEEGAILHVSNTTPETREVCGADATSVCSSIVHDPCLLDVGSALACGSSSNIMLKGIYAAENACGEGQSVRFAKPDLKWVNGFFTQQTKERLLKRQT